MDMSFYDGKRVFVTGHTGFKGAWLCKMLTLAGAQVTGYALNPPTDPSLFENSGIEHDMESVHGDVRNFSRLLSCFESASPEIVFHLAAQPIVLESYRNPHYTYETNVMGTVNVLECARLTDSVKSFVNVTTDKVYENKEWCWGFRENERLDGFDPYSNSKACSELISASYRRAFFDERNIAVSSARAGNVIGGGDFASGRIVPDCVAAALCGKPIILRNPNSIRPYQHVLESLYAYLMIAAGQYDDMSLSGSYNVGPNESDYITTGELVSLFCECWGEDILCEFEDKNGPHEAGLLKLDCSKLKSVFGWKPRWNIENAIKKTVEWTKTYESGGDIELCMDKQINDFLYHTNIE